MYNVEHQQDGSVAITEVGDSKPLYTLRPDTFLTYKVPGGDLEVRQVKEITDDASLIRALMFKWTAL